MENMPASASQQAAPPPRIYGIGVTNAIAMGWRLLVANFNILWLIGLVAHLSQAYLGLLGAAPYIGALVSVAVTVFIQPPLTAGLVYAIRRKAEGRGVRLEDLFEGFRQRYWQAVVTILPQLGVGIFFGGVIVAALVVEAIALGVFAGSITWDTPTVVTAVAIAMGTLGPLLLALVCVSLFFVFSPVAVWDHPSSGWAAVRTSARLVRAHFGATFLLQLAFGLIYLGAFVAGVVTCCAGLLVTIPFALVWHHAALVYLYRSWLSEEAFFAGAPPPLPLEAMDSNAT